MFSFFINITSPGEPRGLLLQPSAFHMGHGRERDKTEQNKKQHSQYLHAAAAWNLTGTRVSVANAEDFKREKN